MDHSFDRHAVVFFTQLAETRDIKFGSNDSAAANCLIELSKKHNCKILSVHGFTYADRRKILGSRKSACLPA